MKVTPITWGMIAALLCLPAFSAFGHDSGPEQIYTREQIKAALPPPPRGGPDGPSEFGPPSRPPGHFPGPGGCFNMPPGPPPGPGGLPCLLNLSDEQMEKVMSMQDQLEEKCALKRAELRSSEHKLHLCLLDSPGEKSKIDNIQGKINQLRADLCGLNNNFAADFSQLLTDEQRKQLRHTLVKGGPGCGPPPPF